MAFSKLDGKGIDLSSNVLTSFASTGIDDNATATAITIDANEDLLVGTNTLIGTSGGANLQNIQVAVDGTARMLISDTGSGGKTFGFYTASGKGGIYNYTDANYDLVIDGDNNSIAIGTNSNIATLTGNTSGVGTSSKFKIVGSVGETQIANTGNLIAFSRDAANYISATGSNASLIYDSPTHYFKSGTNTYATLNDNLILDGGLVESEEFRYTGGTGRRVSKKMAVSSYWTQNEYLEVCTITPNGNSQNYFIEGVIKAQSSQSLDIVRFSVSVRAQTLPAIVYYGNYDRERVGGNFQLKPFIWYDTTNGVVKVVVKNQSTANIHNTEMELNITGRTAAQARDNVSYSGAERTAVTSGFTEQDTFIFRKESFVSDTEYVERQVQRPHIHGTPYGTDGQIATGMRVRQSNNLSFITDRITVPRDGVYLITFNSLSANNVTTRTDLNIRVNGTTVAADLDMAQGSNDYSGKSTQVAVSLSQNDYIQFFNTDWYTNTPSTFDNWQQVSVTYIG